MELQKLIDFVDECNYAGLFDDWDKPLPNMDNCQQELEIHLISIGKEYLEKKRKELYGF